MTPEGLTLVLVDDDDGHIELLRRGLRRHGLHFELRCFGDGAAALDHLEQLGSTPAASRELVVLLDINMPGIDGVEVLSRLKGSSVTQHIPVLMLTTTDDPREIQRCRLLGCDVHVIKPVQPSALLDAIRQLGLQGADVGKFNAHDETEGKP